MVFMAVVQTFDEVMSSMELVLNVNILGDVGDLVR